MIYTDEKTIQTIQEKATQFINACDIALSYQEQIKNIVKKFENKSITGNKKRFTEAIKAINENLTVIIDFDKYCGASVDIYYFDNTQGKYTESTHFYLLRCYDSKDNIFAGDCLEKIDAFCEQLKKQKARLQYTAENATKIIADYKKHLEELNKIHSDCSADLLEIANIKSFYYA